MVVKLICSLYPNGTHCGVKFTNGSAEVDSIHTDILSELMKVPFIKIDTPVAAELKEAIDGGEVSVTTFRNRLNRKTKAEILKVAEDLKVNIQDKSAPIKKIVDAIIKAKYPQKE